MSTLLAVPISYIHFNLYCGFHRRHSSLLQDIQYVAKNAADFNELDSEITRNACRLVESIFIYMEFVILIIIQNGQFPRREVSLKIQKQYP
jgi:hypothetical protein